jgi:uncharacterized OsmC-like protein
VCVQAALAHADRSGQVPDRQALQPVDGGQRRGRPQDRPAGAFPVGPGLHALAACLTGTVVYHAAARGIALDGLETTIQGDLDLHGFLGLDSSVRPGYEQIQVTIKAAGDFDDNQFAELASLTRYSPVRDIVSNPVPVAIDVARA